MDGEFSVTAGAGSFLDLGLDMPRLPHKWTEAGVSVAAAFTGGHLLHLAVAGCVLNDAYREAERLGIALTGVRVRASGGFRHDTWASTGINYTLELDADAPPGLLAELLAAVDSVAEIPRALRAGATVHRVRASGP